MYQNGQPEATREVPATHAKPRAEPQSAAAGSGAAAISRWRV